MTVQQVASIVAQNSAGLTFEHSNVARCAGPIGTAITDGAFDPAAPESIEVKVDLFECEAELGAYLTRARALHAALVDVTPPDEVASLTAETVGAAASVSRLGSVLANKVGAATTNEAVGNVGADSDIFQTATKELEAKLAGWQPYL